MKRRRFTAAEKQQWHIDRAHERRANDPVKQAKITAQAYRLIEERKAILGDNWRDGCAIRLPKGI